MTQPPPPKLSTFPIPNPPSISTPPSTPLPQRNAVAPGAGALQEETLQTLIARIDARGQHLLDRVAPYKRERWLTLVVMLIIFMIRMILLEGFYIVTYVLFIFILNQFILFLQPKDRASLLAKAAAKTSPSGEDEDEASTEKATALPTMDDEEFRPFVRRLPEFRFWYSTTYATFLAFCATFFDAFDVPVFWPLLLFYFAVLFITTMRRQWLDMKKLKYVPWDIGAKKVYKSDPKRVAVTKTGPVDVVAASGRSAETRPVPMVNVVTKKPMAGGGSGAGVPPISPALVQS